MKVLLYMISVWLLLAVIALTVITYNIGISDITEFFHWLITIKLGWNV